MVAAETLQFEGMSEVEKSADVLLQVVNYLLRDNENLKQQNAKLIKQMDNCQCRTKGNQRKGSVQSKRIWHKGRNIQGESQCINRSYAEVCRNINRHDSKFDKIGSHCSSSAKGCHEVEINIKRR